MMFLAHWADNSNHFMKNARKSPPAISSEMVGSPSYLILLSHIAGPRDSLCDICYTTHHLSLCILLISREYRFVTSFLQPTFSSFPNTSLPHPLCRIFFFILSLSFIFDPFSSLGHWSFCLSPCSLLSSVLPNSSTSLLSLAWPFLSVFFSLASGSLKNIQNLSSLSASGLCVLPFLFVYVSLCPTDHPVCPSARFY